MKTYIHILFLTLFLCITSGFGKTYKSGILKRNELWTPENSPYIITGDLLIPPDVKLTIRAGVKIELTKATRLITGIPQEDVTDTFTVAIRVQGALKCLGKKDERITLSPKYPKENTYQWYGIIIDSERDNEIEIAYTTISNACNGVYIKKGAPVLRNVAVHYSNIGVKVVNKSKPGIYNCVLAYNGSAGLFVHYGNPAVRNTLIVYNKAYGIWSDGKSFIDLKYNCIFGNLDMNLYKCDPRLGVLSETNHNDDTTDYNYNLYSDPIFAGSWSHSQAIEKDATLPTDKSKVKDTTVAKLFHETLVDSTADKARQQKYPIYTLSPYSPCIDAGERGSDFRDKDGSRNDMGIWGGNETADLSRKSFLEF